MTPRPSVKPFTFGSSRALFRHHLVKAKWVEFAVQLNEGMVLAMKQGDGMIHATVEEVADWGGVSHRTAWTAWKHLKALGWVSSPKRGVIVFDYRRKPAASPDLTSCESAKNAETLKGVLEPSRKGETHPSAHVPPADPPLTPSGAGGVGIEDQVLPVELAPVASVTELVDVAIRTEAAATVEQVEAHSSPAGAAIDLLVAAGVERAGAVRAVKVAKRENRLSLDTLAKITAAVAALPTKPYRPGGLIVAAVIRPSLGAKLVREHDQARGPRLVQQPHQGPPRPPEPVNVRDQMRRQVADSLTVADLTCPDDRTWLLEQGAKKGWALADLRSLPELAGWDRLPCDAQ